MRSFILSCFLIFFHLPAYLQELKLWIDTTVEADLVQLDALGNIYLLNQDSKTLRKLDPDFKLLYQTSLQNNWNAAGLDVSDPFKIILYYPGDYKIHLLDAQLSLIQTLDEAELNEKSVVCHYDSDRLIIYDGNKLSIKNYKTENIENSTYGGLHFVSNAGDVSLRKQKNTIYYIRKNKGLFAYTTQLFEEKKWPDPDMEKADLNEHYLIKIKNNIIFGLKLNNAMETKLYTANELIKSLAVMNHKVGILEGNRLRIWTLH